MEVNNLIEDAWQCEKSGNILEAQKVYENTIPIVRHMAAEEEDVDTQNMYIKYLKEYKRKIKHLRSHVQHHLLRSKLMEKITIPKGSRGYSYKRLFGQHLDDTITEAQVHEPFVTDRYHFNNLLCFLQLLLKKCPKLQYVRLITEQSSEESNKQKNRLNHLKSEMWSHNIVFNYQFAGNMSDAKIMLSNGIVIKTDHGLHLFHPYSKGNLLNSNIHSLCQCLQSDIYIWKSKPFAMKIVDSWDQLQTLNDRSVNRN